MQALHCSDCNSQRVPFDGGTAILHCGDCISPASTALCPLFVLSLSSLSLAFNDKCNRYTVAMTFLRQSFKKGNCNRYAVATAVLCLVCDLFVLAVFLSLSLGK